MKEEERIPSTGDTKISKIYSEFLSAPAGCNGGTEMDGGVRFMNFEGRRVPSTTNANV